MIQNELATAVILAPTPDGGALVGDDRGELWWVEHPDMAGMIGDVRSPLAPTVIATRVPHLRVFIPGPPRVSPRGSIICEYLESEEITLRQLVTVNVHLSEQWLLRCGYGPRSRTWAIGAEGPHR
ncbi:MAG: hypothetical protein WDA75_22950 [Candidatus Latescibacterota bacterium]|jgi:hypothetical protein